MARKYINPAKPSTLVTDKLLGEARERAAAAAARVRAAERADPSAQGWDAEYAAATSAAAATQRRVDALAALRAAQIERSGKRDATVKAADLDAMAAGLAASRDQVAAAAADHLAVPSLADAGVTLPSAPVPVVARAAPLSDVLPAASANGADVSGYSPGPRGVRTVA
jgi:hypothetical protein